MTAPYRHKRLPSLGIVSEREVVDEFRQVERWSVEVQYEMGQRPPWVTFCPDSDGAIPYLDCESGLVQPSPMVYHPDYVITSGNPAITVDATFAFPFDRLLAFTNEAGTEWLGGIGNFSEAPDRLIFVATADPEQWENVATRRALGIGGSSVILDAGTSMALRLPGIEPLTEGYDLQLASDGETLVAVPNPPPDWSATDTSSDTGTVLLNGTAVQPWARFPDGVGTQPEALTVLVPSGTLAGTLVIRVIVRVANNTSRSGTLNLGIGVGSAEPASGAWNAFPIPAGYSGSIVASVIHELTADLTSNSYVRIWFSGQGDHNSFSLETDTTNGDHQLDVSITYGSGGVSPGVTDHQLLTNRDPVTGGAHIADSLSYDNVSSGLAANTVQAAIDEVAASSGGGPTGWGGLVLDYSQNGGQAGDITLPANSVWQSVNINGKATFMPNDSGVLLTSSGTIWMQAATSPSRLTVHALINIDAPGVVVNRDTWVKLRIAVTPDGVSDFTTVGGESRSQWVDTGDLVDQGCTLSASAVVGSPAVGSKYYIQMTNTSNSAVVCKIRAMSFWLEYS